MNLIKYFWIYIITSFIGFIIETIWCYIRNKKIESRKGLIYEPIIPIYGIAGTLLVLISRNFNLNTNKEIFFVGFFVSMIVEFLSSLFQEKLLSTKSWDYSDFPLNVNGRINLLYLLLFGFVTLFLYDIILLPIVEYIFNLKLNNKFKIITLLLLLFNVFDSIISFIAVYRMKERKKENIKSNKFWDIIDSKYTDEYLKKIYPNMVYIN